MKQKNYYSTQPFLAWCLNHYFYSQKHYAYIGSPFYPFRLGNPRTSNPFRAYEDFYEPWKEQDEYSKQISAMRLNLQQGVMQVAPVAIRSNLLRICEKVNLAFFYPIVYCIDLELINPNRRRKAGSGIIAPGRCKPPSNEFLIQALEEYEFTVLFIDLEIEIELKKGIRRDLDILWRKRHDTQFSPYALAILEKNCRVKS